MEAGGSGGGYEMQHRAAEIWGGRGRASRGNEVKSEDNKSGVPQGLEQKLAGGRRRRKRAREERRRGKSTREDLRQPDGDVS